MLRLLCTAALLLASLGNSSLVKKDDKPSCHPPYTTLTTLTTTIANPTTSCRSPYTTLTTKTVTVDTTPTPTITSLDASCTTTPTQTFYSTSGCALTCSTGFCVIDAAVTVPCGCSSLEIRTATITICPTRTPCYQCYTGWGTFRETATCPPTTSPSLS
ncbi:hypothetical protein B0H63DRAFT_515285 [Podospora didyma]|uniref:Uncharacterized protein n=1 Tax=Podospora didyma TaxID=330526 RepID=A0AAE0N2X0_9PEZI|nr:hypothetical protein B0H63DRAFT_515285 [Podospora didyma]